MSGIVNISKNCYVNVVLQLLSSVPDVRNSLVNHGLSECKEPFKDCLKCILYHIVEVVTGHTLSVVDSATILSFLRLVNVNAHNTGDPREFFTNFVRTTIPALQLVFNFNISHAMICSKCHGYHEDAPSSEVFLNIPMKSSSIEAAIKNEFDGEDIDDRTCPNCGRITPIHRWLKVLSHPNYLLVHNTGGSNITIEHCISFGALAVYMLVAFVEYKPAFVSKQTPHYITYKYINEDWIRYDDEIVERVRCPKAARVYLFLFRRAGHSDRLVEPFNIEDIPKSKAYENYLAQVAKASKRTDPNAASGSEPAPSTSSKSLKRRAASVKSTTPRKKSKSSEPDDNPKQKKARSTEGPKTRSKGDPKSSKGLLKRAVKDPPSKDPETPDSPLNDPPSKDPETPDSPLGKSPVKPKRASAKRSKARTRSRSKPKPDQPDNNKGTEPKKVSGRSLRSKSAQRKALKALRSWPQSLASNVSPKGKSGKGSQGKTEPKKKVLSGYKIYTFGKTRGRITTVKDLGKRNKRRDGKSKRSYKYVRWDSTQADKGYKHKSHVDKKFAGKVISQQDVPGYCLLCPKKGYFTKAAQMERHYEKVHLKNAVVLGRTKLLKCKCSDVPNRGTDESTRNSHYHCINCHKPCDKKSQIATHGISKHDYDPDKVAFLFEKDKSTK